VSGWCWGGCGVVGGGLMEKGEGGGGGKGRGHGYMTEGGIKKKT